MTPVHWLSDEVACGAIVAVQRSLAAMNRIENEFANR